MNAEPLTVKNFLLETARLQSREKMVDLFKLGQGVMPASFKVHHSHPTQKTETLLADFGEIAIGRVAPVDSGLWWIFLLHAYTKYTHNSLTESPHCQRAMRLILNLWLSEGFDTFPALLCADGCSMIDRRMMCHRNGVIHRDLKPENFLYANKKESSPLKAIDFGLSVFFQPDERFTEIVGSPHYMAPEVLKRNYGPEIDVLSAGVILYILLYGVPPFWAETELGVAHAIRSVVDFKGESWPRVSEPAKDLVRRMLDPNPVTWLTPAQGLEHPWLHDSRKNPDIQLGDAVQARLTQFSLMNKLKKKALRVIPEHLSTEEGADIKQMFDAMDINKNGKLTFEQFKAGLRKLGNKMHDSDLQMLMDAADVDKSGTLDYGEFVTVSVHVKKIGNDEHIQEGFSYFDRNKSGYIETEELREALTDEFEGPADEDITSGIIHDVDTYKRCRSKPCLSVARIAIMLLVMLSLSGLASASSQQSCEVASLATNIRVFCGESHPSSLCCDSLKAAATSQDGIKCLCLVGNSPDILTMGFSAQSLIGLNNICSHDDAGYDCDNETDKSDLAGKTGVQKSGDEADDDEEPSRRRDHRQKTHESDPKDDEERQRPRHRADPKDDEERQRPRHRADPKDDEERQRPRRDHGRNTHKSERKDENPETKEASTEILHEEGVNPSSQRKVPEESDSHSSSNFTIGFMSALILLLLTSILVTAVVLKYRRQRTDFRQLLTVALASAFPPVHAQLACAPPLVHAQGTVVAQAALPVQAQGPLTDAPQTVDGLHLPAVEPPPPLAMFPGPAEIVTLLGCAALDRMRRRVWA